MQIENPLHGVICERQPLNIRYEDRSKCWGENLPVKVRTKDSKIWVPVCEKTYLRLRDKMKDA